MSIFSIYLFIVCRLIDSGEKRPNVALNNVADNIPAHFEGTGMYSDVHIIILYHFVIKLA